MNWTKIPTNLLIDRTPDNEMIAIVKYQLLWAELEYQPTDETALRYMTSKQLALVKHWLNTIKTQVAADIKSANTNRIKRKLNYTKNKELKEIVTDTLPNTVTDTVTDSVSHKDKIRLDKIRLDKDIDKDIEYNFNIFWNNYIPVRITDGRIVNKGSRKDAFAKYTRIIKSGEKPENILQGLVAYLKNCQQNNIMTCGATVFLNQERWKNEYNTPTIIAQPHRQPTQKELKDFEYEQKKAALLAEIEKRTTK